MKRIVLSVLPVFSADETSTPASAPAPAKAKKTAKKAAKKGAKKPAKKVAKKPGKKPAKKVAKKGAKKAPAGFRASGDGYKGHQKGSLKEKLHVIFDKHSKDMPKAYAEAAKLDVSHGTITTSFSQFRTGKYKKAA